MQRPLLAHTFAIGQLIKLRPAKHPLGLLKHQIGIYLWPGLHSLAAAITRWTVVPLKVVCANLNFDLLTEDTFGG